MAEPQAAAVAAKSRGGRRRKFIETKLEVYDVWVKDDNPIEQGQLAKLSNDTEDLCKTKSNWKEEDPRHEEAQRYLDKMRGKREEATNKFGRYTKKAAAVDEAEAQVVPEHVAVARGSDCR